MIEEQKELVEIGAMHKDCFSTLEVGPIFR